MIRELVEERHLGYMVLIHPAEEGGYWAEVPALSGCLSQGESVEEAIENARDAIQCHLSCCDDDA